MKKSLVALAALAVVGAASAQSTVTLYGQVDAAYTYANSEGINKSTVSNSQLGSSLLGFKGTEDLGGGLKANFKLEGGLANDSGNGKASNTNNQASGAPAAQLGAQGLVFQRFAYVGLSGGFGEVRLGRDYTSTFLFAQAAVDPFATNGPADSTLMMLKLAALGYSATGTNASNMVEYTTPTMGGFSGNLQYFLGENNSNAVSTLAAGYTLAGVDTSSDGNGYSAQAQYANGPILVSIAQQQTKYAVTGDYTLRALAASYNFGVAKAVYTYAHEGVNATVGNTHVADAKNDSNMIGVVAPFGAANFKADYIRSTKNLGTAGEADTSGTMFALGVDYAMSKRTTLYTTIARVTNSDNVAAANSYYTGIVNTVVNPTSSNIAIGVKHSF